MSHESFPPRNDREIRLRTKRYIRWLMVVKGQRRGQATHVAHEWRKFHRLGWNYQPPIQRKTSKRKPR